MPEWLVVGLLTLAGIGLTAGGAVIGSLMLSKTAKRTDTQSLVDQLQEELVAHRSEQSARSTAQDERMNRLETYSDGYRNHAHELRAHIWDGNPPPPPEWPANLPR